MSAGSSAATGAKISANEAKLKRQSLLRVVVDNSSVT